MQMPGWRLKRGAAERKTAAVIGNDRQLRGEEIRNAPGFFLIEVNEHGDFRSARRSPEHPGTAASPSAADRQDLVLPLFPHSFTVIFRICSWLS